MWTYPNIDPVAWRMGPLTVHWYGVMYLLGFLGGWVLAVYQVRVGVNNRAELNREDVSDLLTACMLGVLLGGRLGSMLFYQWATWMHNPLQVFRIWEGGMSYHGGLIGVIVALFWFAKRRGKRLLDLLDFVAVCVPLGLGAGRLGNFINGELWGKVTTLPWGMVFPGAGPLPRHPTQLYELLGEGVLLLGVLWVQVRRSPGSGWVAGWFALVYALVRIVVEFYRVPDPQYGYLYWGWVTMGQVLSLPMVLVGGYLLFRSRYLVA